MKKYWVYLKTANPVKVESPLEPEFKPNIGWVFYIKDNDKNYTISKVFPAENILYFERTNP